jgi:thiamine-phosphate pyrophosphorylase
MSKNNLFLESPSIQRILLRCRKSAAGSMDERVWIGSLLLSLLHDESLAAAALRILKLDVPFLNSGALGPAVADLTHAHSDEKNPVGDVSAEPRSVHDPDDPESFTRIIDRAMVLGRKDVSGAGLTSKHLLLAATQISDLLERLLKVRGLTVQDVNSALGIENIDDVLPVPPDAAFQFSLSNDDLPNSNSALPATNDGIASPADPVRPLVPAGACQANPALAWRVVDANLNRSREGLRVLEDYSRFVIDDSVLTERVKQLRHTLVTAEQQLPGESMSIVSQLQGHRNTEADVGTSITVANESNRDSLSALVRANCRRVEESLRSLEEFGKLLSPVFAASMKQLRYRTYTLEGYLTGQLHASDAGCAHGAETDGGLHNLAQQLSRTHLYVLVTEQHCRLPWKQFATLCLESGADALQLREKHLTDRELISRARWIVDACKEQRRLCFVNDRPDIARLANAHGVHVGQAELTCLDARALADHECLVGVSTHEPGQSAAAVLATADYLGVGPVFASQTKSFSRFAGLEYVRQIAQDVRIPWFAIGGISLDNVDDVLAAGATRIAVTSSVSQSPAPGETVAEFLSKLKPQ